MTIFDFENFEFITVDFESRKGCIVRIAGTTHDPYFCGKDVCKILGYKKYKALSDHVDVEDKKCLKDLKNIARERKGVMLGNSKIPCYNKGRAIYINESGLYSIILSSKTKFAKEFKKIVCKEIIPLFRKVGHINLESMFQLKLEEKDKTIDDLSYNNKLMERRFERTKSLMYKNNIRDEKLEWVYIATSKNYSVQRIFKIGSTERLSKRLSNYNTGRVELDIFFYCWIRQCYKSRDLDYVIQRLLHDFKYKDSQEMYVGIMFEDLTEIVDFICDNYDKSVEMVNAFIKRRLYKSLEEEDKDVPVIDIKNMDHLNVEFLEKNKLHSLIRICVDNYEDGCTVNRKELLSEVEDKICGYDRKSLWVEIKEMFLWKDSKTVITLPNKKIKIQY